MRPAKRSALRLMADAVLGMLISVVVILMLCLLAGFDPMAKPGLLAVEAIGLLLGLAWLWSHRSPDNTHFTHVLSAPERKASAFRLMLRASLAVLFLGGPMTFTVLSGAGLASAPAAAMSGLVVVGVPVWLWFRRAPDNTRFIIFK